MMDPTLCRLAALAALVTTLTLPPHWVRASLAGWAPAAIGAGAEAPPVDLRPRRLAPGI